MKAIWQIIKFSRTLWPYYVAIALFVIVLSVLNLATPFLTKGLIDGLTSKFSGQNVAFSYFMYLLIAILLVNVVITLLDNINGFLGDVMATKLNNLLSERYFAHLMKLPIGYFDNEITGTITGRLDRSIGTIAQLMQTLSNNFVQFFLTTAITLVAISLYSWPVAVLLAVIFPAYIYLTHLSSKAWQKHQGKINEQRDVGNGRFVESIAQVRVVKSFVTELREQAFFSGTRRKIAQITVGQSKQWHRYDIYRRFILNLIFFAIYAIIIWQAYKMNYTLGTVVLLITLANQAQWPLFGSSFIIDALQRATADSKDYFAVMQTKPDIEDSKDATKLNIKQGAIVYNKLDFAYQAGPKVLKGVSFGLEAGKKLALVGESGEGKSTIANLLLRFYEPSSGSITIDGIDINTVTQASLRDQIGVVFQEPQLFSGSIAENICYAKGKVSHKEMIAAAKAANAYEFVQKLPKGFNSQIGERGVKLSGGQKQRIAIARAIVKNPPILILDEATSSLDSKAEAEVQQALKRLMQDRTTLIIAHRLSTIADVDTIVGIKGGKVVEIGSPSELAKSKTGIYAELLKLQTIATTKAGKAKLKKYDLAG